MKTLMFVFVAALCATVAGCGQSKVSDTQVARAETINCGLKTITVQNGKIDQIKHEEGTIHSGTSISNNWSYDGKSIKHRLDKDPIPCGTAPKSRDEIIAELSSPFVKDPSDYNMDKQEAQWMTSYTVNLMKTDKNCYFLVFAAKSTLSFRPKDTFYIDCNDQSGNSHRYWVSRADLESQT